MIKYIDQSVSKIAIAVLIGGVSLAHPAYANDYATASPHRGMSKHHNHMDPPSGINIIVPLHIH